MLPTVFIRDAIGAYLERCRLRGHAANSLRAYRADLISFEAFARDRHACTVVATVGTRLIDRWLDELARSGSSPRSQARRLSVLKSWLGYCRREGWIEHDAAADITVRWRPKPVTAPEMESLLAMIDAIPPAALGTWEDVRDRAMLRLALDSGLRIGEVAALDVPGDRTSFTVDLKALRVRVPKKGGGAHEAPFGATTGRMLEAWLNCREGLEDVTSAALFLSRRGTRFTRQGLHALVKRRGAAVGLGDIHWHLLRHRRIGDIVERLGIYVGQGVAGHASATTTTAVYGRHAQAVVHRQVRQHCDLDAYPQGRAHA